MRTLLLLAAVIPPVFLMYKIYKIDRVEREPIGLILKLFLFGMLITLPAGYIERFFEGIIGTVLSEKSFAYRFISNFFIVAWAEEGLKHFALKRGSWRHTAFDYRFDAIVYSVAVTLGFAAFENIGYVFSYGFGNALGNSGTLYIRYIHGILLWNGKILRSEKGMEKRELLPIFKPVYSSFDARLL